MNRDDRYRIWTLLGMGVGLGIGVLTARRLALGHPLPHGRRWHRTFVAQRGADGGRALAARVQRRYNMLYNERPRVSHPALRWHLHRQILPGLALYRVLQEEGRGREEILGEVQALLAQANPQSWLAVLRYLPAPFTLLRRALPWALLGYPAAGWNMGPIERSDHSIAVTVRGCFYLDVLRAYGAAELTPLYCALDDVAAARLPASIRWERTMTLGRGQDCCDFRWSRVAPPHLRTRVDAGCRCGCDHEKETLYVTGDEGDGTTAARARSQRCDPTAPDHCRAPMWRRSYVLWPQKSQIVTAYQVDEQLGIRWGRVVR